MSKSIAVLLIIILCKLSWVSLDLQISIWHQLNFRGIENVALVMDVLTETIRYKEAYRVTQKKGGTIYNFKVM